MGSWSESTHKVLGACAAAVAIVLLICICYWVKVDEESGAQRYKDRAAACVKRSGTVRDVAICLEIGH